MAIQTHIEYSVAKSVGIPAGGDSAHHWLYPGD
jgi:hypothetical protein